MQLADAWGGVRWVLADLSDDEYLWEPAERVWSVRRRAEGVSGWGTGEFICEDAWPPPKPVPIPTIGWRVVHLAAWTEVYSAWAFTDLRPGLGDLEVPGDASGGIAWLYRSQDQFSAHVAQLDDDSVFDPRPAHWGELVPVARLVSSLLTEHVHHIAEIGLLRDLRRGHARVQPLPPPTAGPAWWAART